MDFDELDALEDEERQRRALAEIRRERETQMRRAAQEEHRQRLLQREKQRQPQQSINPTQQSNHPRETQQQQVYHLKPRRSRFAEFQTKQHSEVRQGTQAEERSAESPDPAAAFAERLLQQSQVELEVEKSWQLQQLSGEHLPVHSAHQEDLVADSEAAAEVDADEVPAIDELLAILDNEDAEEQEFEHIKPYLPDLDSQAPRSIVATAEDGGNPFVTQAVRIFQEQCPEVDLVSILGEHHKTVIRAAAHRSQAGHVEQLQLMNVEMASEEKRMQEEQKRMLRSLRQRRYMLQEGRRALGVDLSNSKVSKEGAALVLPARTPSSSSSATPATAPALGFVTPANGFRFPGMDAPHSNSGEEPEVCFPKASAISEQQHACSTEPHDRMPGAKPARARQPLMSSLPTDKDEERFSLEDLTGLPPPEVIKSIASKRCFDSRILPVRETVKRQEEQDRHTRALEQKERLQRLKERRLEREKQKALQAVRSGSAGSWGPLGTLPISS